MPRAIPFQTLILSSLCLDPALLHHRLLTLLLVFKPQLIAKIPRPRHLTPLKQFDATGFDLLDFHPMMIFGCNCICVRIYQKYITDEWFAQLVWRLLAQVFAKLEECFWRKAARGFF